MLICIKAYADKQTGILRVSLALFLFRLARSGGFYLCRTHVRRYEQGD